MTEPAALAQYARCARRALAEAHTATLLVDGLGRVDPDPAHVLLDHQDGRPRFTCAAGSPIAAAAAQLRPAILDVAVPPSDELCAGSVIFAGHLGVHDTASVGHQVLELHLVTVVVEVDDPRSRTLLARRVPLEVYGAGGAADLGQAAETIRVHTNAMHTARLRACAAARAGLAEGDIIEATLIEVAADGSTRAWLDGEGSHVVRMGFPRPAADGPQLVAALRAQLCAHRRCP